MLERHGRKAKKKIKWGLEHASGSFLIEEVDFGSARDNEITCRFQAVQFHSTGRTDIHGTGSQSCDPSDENAALKARFAFGNYYPS